MPHGGERPGERGRGERGRVRYVRTGGRSVLVFCSDDLRRGGSHGR